METVCIKCCYISIVMTVKCNVTLYTALQHKQPSSYSTPLRPVTNRPQIANGGDVYHTWRVAGSTLKKQSRTADNGSSSRLGVGRRINKNVTNVSQASDRYGFMPCFRKTLGPPPWPVNIRCRLPKSCTLFSVKCVAKIWDRFRTTVNR